MIERPHLGDAVGHGVEGVEQRMQPVGMHRLLAVRLSNPADALRPIVCAAVDDCFQRRGVLEFGPIRYEPVRTRGAPRIPPASLHLGVLVAADSREYVLLVRMALVIEQQ
ncbi:hypothetical protein C8039_03155 [Halogeometricum sp. wsp3]|nr:hypothetical protein C8039_03155 [Halogeometricum sp. wsp3]